MKMAKLLLRRSIKKKKKKRQGYISQSRQTSTHINIFLLPMINVTIENATFAFVKKNK